MGKISYDHIQQILDSFSDKNKALETVKSLLVSNGYTEHHDEERLLFINSSGSHTHTIDINLKKYAKEKVKPKDINEIVDTILNYHKMMGEGIITQEEFDSIKKDLLS